MSDIDDHVRAIVRDDVLDVPGAAELLHVSRDTIYTLCARQQIPHRKIGRLLRFSRTALMGWLSACGSDQGAQKGT